MNKLTLEDRGKVFDANAQPTNQRAAFFTGLCPLQSGAWLCGFQVGTAKHSADGTIQICRSIDGGQTWTTLNPNLQTHIDGVPGSLSTPAIVETTPGHLLLAATWYDRSEPDRPLFDPETQGILHSKLVLSESTDDGDTWSSWRILETPGLRGCAGTGEIVRWLDGTIAVSFESYREFDDPEPQDHAAWTVVSRDGGQTFSDPILVAEDPDHNLYFWDQRLCATESPGEYASLFWTHDLNAERDRNVHMSFGSINERNAAAPAIWETELVGQIAASLMLDDNYMLAFVVDRSQPCTLTICRSTDRGETWPETDRLIVHTHDEKAAITQGQQNVDFNQYWEDMGKWSFGHPALRRLNDSQVLCAYYAGSPDCMSIHWAVVNV